MFTYNISGGIPMTDREVHIESCSCSLIHEDVVKRVGINMIREEELFSLAEIFKIFGDPTRLKILNALFEAEMCVCDISALLNMTQSAISHQLKVLKQARLVKYRREGKVVYYSLDDDHIKHIFDEGLVHIRER